MSEAKDKKMPLFAARFGELRGDRTQAEFAEFLGISRPTVGFYENGERIPDALVLRQIAERCGVTADYLVGLSDNRVPENEGVGHITGLSDEAVENLAFLKDLAADVYSPFIASRHFCMLVVYLAQHQSYQFELCDTFETYKELLRRLVEQEAEESERNACIAKIDRIEQDLELVEYRAQKLFLKYIELYERDAAQAIAEQRREIEELFTQYTHCAHCPDPLKQKGACFSPYWSLEEQADEEEGGHAADPETR